MRRVLHVMSTTPARWRVGLASHQKLRAFPQTAQDKRRCLRHHVNQQNVYKQHIDDSMRRKQSDELPRFVSERSLPGFRWNRRYSYFVAGFIFVCWLLYPSRSASPTAGDTTVVWSNYAYSLYATDSATLCHAILIADALARLGSKADRVLFYPEYWDTKVSDSKDRDSQLLVLARDKYKVKLQPIKLLTVGGRTKGTHRELHTLDPPFKAVTLRHLLGHG
jgi:hypothetical protein